MRDGDVAPRMRIRSSRDLTGSVEKIVEKGVIVQADDLSKIKDSDREAIAELAQRAGVNLKDCYQCGKCSAGCPMGGVMDLLPRQVIRDLQLGFLEDVLNAKTPWICAGCNVCSCRCPQEIDVATLMQEVRRTSKATGHQPYPEADKFDDIFIGNVRKFGTSHEVGLAMKFNMSSGHLFQDVGNSTKMLKHGMLKKGRNIEHIDEVQKLMDRALKESEEK